mmetsp:Transcript_4738/g.13142  ORF Transcript_4738/g.13142 Transcript_4738/m.13142 type:complete len:293 (+) Transcript_4738:212-1090(+)
MVVIRSCRGAPFNDGHPALACNVEGEHGFTRTGEVQANRWGPAQAWEQWTIRFVDGDDGGEADVAKVLSRLEEERRPVNVGLRAHTGGWLQAKPDGEVWADGPELQDWETWRLEPLGRGRFAFKSHHGRYLCRDGGSFGLPEVGSTVNATRKRVMLWEQWYIVFGDHEQTCPGKNAELAIKGSVIAAGSVLTACSLAIPLLGFGVAGVAAGSTAAAIQSVFYGGYTSGLFSFLQSVGATGAWIPTAVGGAVVFAAGAGTLAIDQAGGRSPQEAAESSEDDESPDVAIPHERD